LVTDLCRFFILSLAPQPSLGLGLLHKIRLNFLEASQQFCFYRVGLVALRQTPIPEDQASVFISPRHAWVTVGLFLFPGHHTGTYGDLEYKYEGRLQKFMDSPYYSESELCGGAVTVSF
jgi:hypothetical protein